ncbi:uracil-DNA glycosylase [Ramlibacter ginsenosidimutans]|uniref:Uracil-DNA glycosylase n=1 Tax=Ramlibacter ginsenosidimutans TaxID=502333 RepID=A0A934WLA9_9BURK|nr:uracil-DNA glycosylase [Ramlibacter ginsenosidimutans]MBK6005376.1 uracil-DNA glycosylase [Ramlibacter ginsenosidimutans]
MAGRSQADLPWADLEPGARRRQLLEWVPEGWPLAEGWRPVVEDFLASEDGRRLSAFLRARLDAGAVIYPPHPLRALELTPLASVHAVVLGQDPYHGPGQAEGLAFSVADGVKHPPSLRNIFKELGTRPESGSLMPWARSGVLLLNAVLTVEQGEPTSHAKKGWEVLTDRLLALVAATASPCVYLLWGAHAQAKADLIRAHAAQYGREILLLQTNHPSPLSAGRPPVPFLGSGCFRQARDWLAERGIPGVF